MKHFLFLACSLLFSSSLCVACVADGEPTDQPTVEASDLTQALTDAQLQGKLRGILKDVTFMSEADFPYVVFEGEVADTTRLTEAVVREKLRAAIKANTSSERDIFPAECRADSLDVNEAIAADPSE